MIVVMGATGHVGGAVTTALVAAGQPVLAVAHSETSASALRAKGVETAIVDVMDVDALRTVLRRGRRAFLLNPPASPDTDTDAREEASAHAIAAALADSGLEKVVLESTYGAQPGQGIGDLSVLYDFEQAVAAQPIPAAVIRAAYYMTNWDMAQARKGELVTMFPADFRLPMVAPDDLGRAAARLLTTDEAGLHCVEGPARYTPQDVADAFARALGHAVVLRVIPRQDWEAAFRKIGFSDAAARAYTRMTQATVDQGFHTPSPPQRGAITLDAYIAGVLAHT